MLLIHNINFKTIVNSLLSELETNLLMMDRHNIQQQD